MKLFRVKSTIPKNKIGLFLLVLAAIVQSCATHHPQYGKNAEKPSDATVNDTAAVEHTFFLIGDAGNADESPTQTTLSLLKKRLDAANSNSTLLFLGDNIYPEGLPDSSNKEAYELAKIKLENQLKATKGFKGKTIFIPGNHDWYSGLKGLEAQEKMVTEFLKDKKSFLPRSGCPIEEVKIGSNCALIVIDSEWFLEEWDQHPTINDNCEIKTKAAFFEELEAILNKNQEKIKIIAIHHPLMSNGSHGGQYSFKKQIFPFEAKIPLPVIGSFINLLRKTSGANPQDIQNKIYTQYTKRIKTLLQGHSNVVVVSGHDHNLQYIERDNIRQIVSGSGSKTEAAKAVYENDFSFGGNGYVTLEILKSREQSVSYFSSEKGSEKLLWQHTFNIARAIDTTKHMKSIPKEIQSSVYSDDLTKKSMFHNFLFGKHYRRYYDLPITVPTATLNNLHGGLKPTIAGGGHQSKSLRLKDANGKEYVMRALKKSASRFLQTVAFKDQYVEEEFENTYAEKFLLDFYTTSHPYTPLAVAGLADKIGVSHSNPKLFYIPKHKQLQQFNLDYGDELYYVEERPTDSQKDLVSFGKPKAIVGTDDVLKNLRKDEKYSVDENEYIKARLFDMLIGDWDRHHDQWRWGEFEENGKIIYKPIPRDRDQAFTKYDGTLLAIIMNMPTLRHMQTFKDKIRNVKWFNREPYPLDLTFLKTATEKDWIAQAEYIQKNLSDAEIEKAFKNLPKEVQDETISSIIAKLKKRRQQLTGYASEYSKVLQRTIVIVGTDKKDKFIISKNNPKEVEVTLIRLKKSGEELQYKRTISDKNTKEIWIYGLDDDDVFEVTGKAKSSIKIRIIGGQNNDNYKVENGNKIVIYDFRSKPNEYNIDGKTRLVKSDDYELNFYDYEKPKYNFWAGLPAVGFNPDDGIKVGAMANYTVNGFSQNPYTAKHSFIGYYYFATNGFELNYDFKYPNFRRNWHFELASRFTSPNFAINFFGYGNETENNDRDEGMDYNRVKLQLIRVMPTFKRVGRMGSEFSVQTSFENIEVEMTANRFIDQPGIVNPEVFHYQQFAGAKMEYRFENYDTKSNATMGMGFAISGSWKTNLNDTKRNFPSLEAQLNFNHKLDSKARVVFATLFKGKYILNTNYEFYQGATLGGDLDLRGYRNERFLGSQSFFQSSDLRWNLGKIRGGLLPMSYGLLGGFDYGRVWLENEDSDQWHQSYGGGIWLNGLNVLTARLSYFQSTTDRGRVVFGLGFGF